ncbi:MAG: glycosyltransferase [Marinilabiliaceae bacterium]|nr:glycosyltransferase [Marinilabiliaceae bacterium]
MTILSLIILALMMLLMLVAWVNVLFGARLGAPVMTDELVSVLIPARNEQANIGRLLDSLLRLRQANIEVLVYDDQSTDATAAIVQSYERRDKRVRLLPGDHLPEGWMGKNHACHQLSTQASGRWLLFLDADVVLTGNIIGSLVGYASRHELGLVSLFPHQVMRTRGEKIAVPLMYIILLTLLPLPLVRRSVFSSLAAANGQLMFFDARVYSRLQPHLAVRHHRVEDIAIARFFKSSGVPVACLMGDARVMCRMYSGWKDAKEGFSKNIFEFFGGLLLPALLYCLLTTFGLAFIALQGSLMLIASYFMLWWLTRAGVALVSRQLVVMHPRWMTSQQIAMVIIMGHALRNRFKKQLLWKGRNVYG